MRRMCLFGFIAMQVGWAETPLTLHEAVRIALERHPEVAKAHASADVLKGKIREVRSQALPDIQIVSNAMRWRDPTFLNTSGLEKFPEEVRNALVPSAVNIFDFGITVRQPLFTWGRVRTAVRLASIESESALSEIDRTQQDIALATVRVFYDLLWAERYRDLVSETQEQKKLHAAMARTRYQNGVATEVDVLRSEVALANGTPDLVRSENCVKQGRAQLNYYLGRPLDSALQLLGEFQENPWPQMDVEAMEEDAIRRRPEIQRLRTAERSAAAQLQLAHAESRMKVEFSSSFGMVSTRPQNLFDSKFSRWTAGVNLTLPVFDGFKRKGLVEQATANHRIANLERSKFEQQVRLTVQQGYDDVRTAAETIAAATKTVKQAETVLKMTHDNYRYGAATTLDVVDAQTAVSLARTNLLRGLRDHSVARANLRWAMGQTPWE